MRRAFISISVKYHAYQVTSEMNKNNTYLPLSKKVRQETIYSFFKVEVTWDSGIETGRPVIKTHKIHANNCLYRGKIQMRQVWLTIYIKVPHLTTHLDEDVDHCRCGSEHHLCNKTHAHTHTDKKRYKDILQWAISGGASQHLLPNIFYPGVFADVPTSHFLSLHPQFTGLGSGKVHMLFQNYRYHWKLASEEPIYIPIFLYIKLNWDSSKC